MSDILPDEDDLVFGLESYGENWEAEQREQMLAEEREEWDAETERLRGPARDALAAHDAALRSPGRRDRMREEAIAMNRMAFGQTAIIASVSLVKSGGFGYGSEPRIVSTKVVGQIVGGREEFDGIEGTEVDGRFMRGGSRREHLPRRGSDDDFWF